MSRSNERSGYLFILPSFIHLLVFLGIPFIAALYLAFCNWSIIGKAKSFIGLANFIDLLTDSYFHNAMKNTAYYTVLSVPLGMAASLAIAVVMNQKLRAVAWFRTLFFLPVVTSWVAVSLIWTWMLDRGFGLLNYLLRQISLPVVDWLGDARWAMISLVLITIWKGAGFQMVIWLAGLQSIPDTYYEAAVIDGANKWGLFRHVTFPLLLPTTFFLLVTSVIGSFQVFTPVFVMTQGGPMRSTDVMVFHIYKNAFQKLQMGYASAQAWVLFGIIFLVTLVQVYYMRRKLEDYSI